MWWPLWDKGCWSSCDRQVLAMCINCEFSRLGSYFWIGLMKGLELASSFPKEENERKTGTLAFHRQEQFFPGRMSFMHRLSLKEAGDVDDEAERCWRQHCAAMNRKWDGGAASESLFLLSSRSYWERAVSALQIVPKVTMETLQVSGTFKDLKSPFLNYQRRLDHFLSQNREKQMKIGSFKIMRNIWRHHVETKQLHFASTEGAQVKSMDRY